MYQSDTKHKTHVGTVILIFVREEYKTNSVIKDRAAVA